MNWGPIMKTINDDPYDFFQQGGWSFLGGTAVEEVSHLSSLCLDGRLSFTPQSEAENDSMTESEYEAEDFGASSSSDSEESAYSEDGSDASDDEGSGSDFDDDSDGEDWDELERKAAKGQCLVSQYHLHMLTFATADKKRIETGKGHESDDSDRPKKKAAPKGKTNGKKA